MSQAIFCLISNSADVSEEQNTVSIREITRIGYDTIGGVPIDVAMNPWSSEEAMVVTSSGTLSIVNLQVGATTSQVPLICSVESSIDAVHQFCRQFSSGNGCFLQDWLD